MKKNILICRKGQYMRYISFFSFVAKKCALNQIELHLRLRNAEFSSLRNKAVDAVD